MQNKIPRQKVIRCKVGDFFLTNNYANKKLYCYDNASRNKKTRDKTGWRLVAIHGEKVR